MIYYGKKNKNSNFSSEEINQLYSQSNNFIWNNKFFLIFHNEYNIIDLFMLNFLALIFLILKLLPQTPTQEITQHHRHRRRDRLRQDHADDAVHDGGRVRPYAL